MREGVPGEEGAAEHDEEGVDQTVEGLGDEGQEVAGRRYPVGESTDGDASSFYFLPVADESDPEGALEASVEDLREEVEVADEGRLEDDRYVGGVEQFDGEGRRHSRVLLVDQLYLHFEALEVYHQEENEDRRQEVR